MSPAVSMSGIGKLLNKSTVCSAKGSIASIFSASARYSSREISFVKPPTTAVIGCTERPPTFVHSSLPKAFRASAWLNSSGASVASGNTLACPVKSGAANTNRCVAWFCRYDP